MLIQVLKFVKYNVGRNSRSVHDRTAIRTNKYNKSSNRTDLLITWKKTPSYFKIGCVSKFAFFFVKFTFSNRLTKKMQIDCMILSI